jgi:thiol-disulfide isomerase/thioredoxin
MTPFRQITARALRRPLLTGLFLVMTLGFAAAFAETPPLPAALKGKLPAPTLLEFYADWCSTCRKMIPVLHRLEEENEGKLNLVRLDIERPANRDWVKLYKVDGTPTYFLFDASGKAVFKMDHYISSTLLMSRVEKQTGTAQRVPFPQSVASAISGKPIVLVQFHQDNCKSCTDTRGYASYLAATYEKDLAVVEVNRKEAAAMAYMKNLGLRKAPAYILFDHDGYELWRLEAPLNKQVQYELWRYINLVRAGRV